MKTANSTNSFPYLQEEPVALFRRMRELGYDAADWDISELQHRIYKSSDAMFDFCRRYREGAEAAGMEIYQAHGPWPTDDRTPESRAVGWEYFHRAIRMCSLAGCHRLVIHPQMPYGWDGTEDPEIAYRLTLDLLLDLMPDCEKYDVIVCMENMPFQNQRISTMERIAEVVQAVGSPYAKICLDTGHANIFDGNDLGETVRQAGELLDSLHVHDNRNHQDLHLLPWWGNADWEHFIEALAASSYTGPLTLETAGGFPDGLPSPVRERTEQLTADAARYLADRVEKLRCENL